MTTLHMPIHAGVVREQRALGPLSVSLSLLAKSVATCRYRAAPHRGPRDAR